MQYVVDPGACPAARFPVQDVALDPFEPASPRANPLFYILDISRIPGEKIIQPNDRLTEFEKRFEKIGANKTGNTGYQPFPRIFAQLVCDKRESFHNRHILSD